MSEINHEFEIDLREYISVIWRRKFLIIGLFVVAVVCTYFLAKTMDPIYETSATILIQKNDSMKSLFANDMFSIGKDLSSTYSRLIKTRGFLDQVIRRMDLRDLNGEYISFTGLRSAINVSAINGTDLIEISIEHKDPERAMQIVNTLVEVFQEKNTEMNKFALAGAREFIEKQLQEVKLKLEKSENDLLNFKLGNDVILPNEEARKTLEKLVDVEGTKSMAEVELKSLDASIRSVQKELSTQQQIVISSTVISNNPLISHYKSILVDLESRLSGLKTKYASSHPEIVSVESEIKKVTEALGKEVAQEVSAQTESINPIYQSLYERLVTLETTWIATQAKMESFGILIVNYENELRNLPEKELELTRLERVARVTSEIYTMLMTRLEEVKISESMQTSNIYLADPAYLPESPIKPNKKMMILLAGFLALFIGFGMSLLFEYLDTSIKSADEVEKMLGLPVLGSIPDIRRIRKMHKK